jgi:phosphoenolpyruvate synthase/pyruvate phosphate dikinase
MSLLVAPDAGEASVRLIGPKAANLIRMYRAGMAVPEIAVLTTVAAATALLDDSAATLRAAIARQTVASTSEIRAAIEEIVLPARVIGAVEDALTLVGGGRTGAAIAVRSSALAEDCVTASFAGQFDSFLAVDGIADVVGRIKAIWASCFGERVLAYRACLAPVQDGTGIPMAVILQRQLYPSKSGVLFTRHPNGELGSMYVEANFGTAQSVVDGTAIPDAVTIDRRSGNVTAHRVAEKTTMTAIIPGRCGSRTITVPKELVKARVLDSTEIAALVEVSGRVEALFGSPQDLEWAIEGNRLWLLQARPITTRPRSDRRRSMEKERQLRCKPESGSRASATR